MFTGETRKIHKDILECVSMSRTAEDGFTDALKLIEKTYRNSLLYVWLVEDGKLTSVYPDATRRDYSLLEESAGHLLETGELPVMEDRKHLTCTGRRILSGDGAVIGIVFVEQLTFAAPSLPSFVAKRLDEVLDIAGQTVRAMYRLVEKQYYLSRQNPLGLPSFDSIRLNGITGLALVRPLNVADTMSRFCREDVLRLLHKWVTAAERIMPDAEFCYGDELGFVIVWRKDTAVFAENLPSVGRALQYCTVKTVSARMQEMVSCRVKIMADMAEPGTMNLLDNPGAVPSVLSGELCRSCYKDVVSFIRKKKAFSPWPDGETPETPPSPAGKEDAPGEDPAKEDGQETDTADSPAATGKEDYDVYTELSEEENASGQEDVPAAPSPGEETMAVYSFFD